LKNKSGKTKRKSAITRKKQIFKITKKNKWNKSLIKAKCVISNCCSVVKLPTESNGDLRMPIQKVPTKT